ncbi:hypothetical protein VDG1235_2014 [Verrucomicrobiia bacterium DG1235]|nr:hypothetical protein VDG1235_2014 [Verrucomicrobiae bacterium DG1235]
MNPRKSCLPALYRTGLTVLGVLAGILLTSCSSVKVANPRTNLELAPAPYFDDKTGIYFPGALGSLFRQPVVELEERSPGLGLAITYRNADTRIDVFVYDLQASIIPTGIDSEVIQRSFQDAISDLSQASKKRIYTNLETGPTSTVSLVDTPFLHARFQYTEALTQKRGQLFVSGVNSQIIKIRTAQTLTSDTDLERLLAYLGHAIEQSRRNGFGGLPTSNYQKIVDQVAQIDLRNGLSEAEAVSIAQIELVNQDHHNRYDVNSAQMKQNRLPSSATITFRQYPTSPARIVETPLIIEVDQNGNATIAEIAR